MILTNIFHKALYPFYEINIKRRLPLLHYCLQAMPCGIREEQSKRFFRYEANTEFCTWIPGDNLEIVISRAFQFGFLVWCNRDDKMAFLYGAGIITQQQQESIIEWMREITLKGFKGKILYQSIIFKEIA